MRFHGWVVFQQRPRLVCRSLSLIRRLVSSLLDRYTRPRSTSVTSPSARAIFSYKIREKCRTVFSLCSLEHCVWPITNTQVRIQYFNLGGTESRSEGPRAGQGSWGGSKPPPHQLGGLGERSKLSQPRPPNVFTIF